MCRTRILIGIATLWVLSPTDVQASVGSAFSRQCADVRASVLAARGGHFAPGGIRAAPRFGSAGRFGGRVHPVPFRPFPRHRIPFRHFPFQPFFGFAFAGPYWPYYYYPYSPYCDPASAYYYPPWCPY